MVHGSCQTEQHEGFLRSMISKKGGISSSREGILLLHRELGNTRSGSVVHSDVEHVHRKTEKRTKDLRAKYVLQDLGAQIIPYEKQDREEVVLKRQTKNRPGRGQQTIN